MKQLDGILKFVQKNQTKPPKEATSMQLIFFNDSGNSLFSEYFEESSTNFETFMSIGDHYVDIRGNGPSQRLNSYSLLDIFSGKVLEAQIISKSWSKNIMAKHISNFLSCIGLLNFGPVCVFLTFGTFWEFLS